MTMTTQIQLSTTNEIVNKKVDAQIGIVVGIGTAAFGPMTSTKAKRAHTKAINELKNSAEKEGANAVIGISITATGAGSFPFARPHTVIMSGTAVKIS